MGHTGCFLRTCITLALYPFTDCKDSMAPPISDRLVPSKRPVRDIPVSLGKPSLRRRLEAYYSLIAPDQIAVESEWLARLDQIWSKFGGTDEGEVKLAAKLANKYGPTVKLLTASASTKKGDNSKASSTPGKAPTIPSDQQHIEEWFELTDMECGSGVVVFGSDQFDPLAALTVTEQAVVNANPGFLQQCPRTDRVDQCRSLLPETDPLYRVAVSRKRRRHESTEPEAGDKPEAGKRTASATNRFRPPSCFSSLAEPYQTGPLSILHSTFVNRQRARVLVRYVNGIRGTVTGYLVAFDKHMNMILRDADEVYSPRVVSTDTVEPLSNVEAELQRRRTGLSGHAESGSTWCVRQRHLPQILIRGDNVVLVYKAESERSAWPLTSKSPVSSAYRNNPKTETPDRRVGTPGSLIYAVQRRPKERGRRSDYTS